MSTVADNVISQDSWRPFGEDAPLDVQWIAIDAIPPKLGQHIGQVHTLPDGRWLILKFSPTRGSVESYFILPEPL